MTADAVSRNDDRHLSLTETVRSLTETVRKLEYRPQDDSAEVFESEEGS